MNGLADKTARQYAEVDRVITRVNGTAADRGRLSPGQSRAWLQSMIPDYTRDRTELIDTLYNFDKFSARIMEMSFVPGLDVWTPERMTEIVRAYSKLQYMQPVGFLFCDFAGLKRANQRYSHEGGNKLLKRLCELLDGTVERRVANHPVAHDRRDRRITPRPVGRILGGDEFGAIIPRATHKQMREMVTSLKNKITERSNHLLLEVSEDQYGAGSSELVAPNADFGWTIPNLTPGLSLQELFSEVYEKQIKPAKQRRI